MIRVGCNRQSASRSEANSEYRLRTSRSWIYTVSRELQGSNDHPAYPSPDRVDDRLPTALQTLPSISDQDRKLGVLVEDLLDAAIVAAGLPPWDHLRLGLIFLVAFDRVCRRMVAGRFGGARSVVLGI